jgi:hypothetical protein
MKQVTHNDPTIGGCLLYFAIIFLTALIMASCCRPATEFQTMKWERKHKFESVRGFWGIHLFNRSQNIKHKKSKEIKIKYK